MGAHLMAPGSTGEVIKENVSLEKVGRNPSMDFIVLLETSHSMLYLHTDTERQL